MIIISTLIAGALTWWLGLKAGGVELTGQIEKGELGLYAPDHLIIEKIRVAEGSSVKAGDTLFSFRIINFQKPGEPATPYTSNAVLRQRLLRRHNECKKQLRRNLNQLELSLQKQSRFKRLSRHNRREAEHLKMLKSEYRVLKDEAARLMYEQKILELLMKHRAQEGVKNDQDILYYTALYNSRIHRINFRENEKISGEQIVMYIDDESSAYIHALIPLSHLENTDHNTAVQVILPNGMESAGRIAEVSMMDKGHTAGADPSDSEKVVLHIEAINDTDRRQWSELAGQEIRVLVKN